MGCGASGRKKPLSPESVKKVETLFSKMKEGTLQTEEEAGARAEAEGKKIGKTEEEVAKLRTSAMEKAKADLAAAGTKSGFTKAQAEKFFKGKFGKLSAEAMFNEVDTDKSDDITQEEFMDFWTQVKKSGYSDDDINTELDEMLENHEKGGAAAWVDWKDDREVGGADKAHEKQMKNA